MDVYVETDFYTGNDRAITLRYAGRVERHSVESATEIIKTLPSLATDHINVYVEEEGLGRAFGDTLQQHNIPFGFVRTRRIYQNPFTDVYPLRCNFRLDDEVTQALHDFTSDMFKSFMYEFGDEKDYEVSEKEFLNVLEKTN